MIFIICKNFFPDILIHKISVKKISSPISLALKNSSLIREVALAT